MVIKTFDQVVAMLKSNSLLQQISSGKYYGDNMEPLKLESENVCFEFVMAMPGVRDLVAEHFQQEDDQMLMIWLKDAVFLDLR